MNIRKKSIPFVVFALIVVISMSGCAKMDFAKNADNSTMTAAKPEPSVKYYGAEVKVDTYNAYGNTYININDLSTLFKTKATYDSSTNSISIGDSTRASAINYIPDLSAYPALENVIGLPPYEVDVGGYIGVDFKFVTKNVPFKDMLKIIEEKLVTDGFAGATEDQYANLIKGHSEFDKGKIENTFIKYKNNSTDVSPYAIQIVDGGVDKNNLPIIIVKMAG